MHGYLWIAQDGSYLTVHEKTWPMPATVAGLTRDINAAYVGMRIPRGINNLSTLGHLTEVPAYAIATRTVRIAATVEQAQQAYMDSLSAAQKQKGEPHEPDDGSDSTTS